MVILRVTGRLLRFYNLTNYFNLRKLMRGSLIIITFSIYVVSMSAMAAVCEYYPDNKQGSVMFTLPTILNVPRDTPNGTVIYESPTVAVGTIPSSFRCSIVHNEGVKNDVGETIPGAEIFPIGRTGIGWQWIRPPSGKVWKGYPMGGNAPGGWGWSGSEHVLRLVKIGTISSNAMISPGSLGSFQSEEINPLRLDTSGTRVIPQSCETPDVKVDMGDYNLSDFLKNGAFSEAKAFALKLNKCSVGINTLRFSLVPAASSPVQEANNGIVNLNSSSTAKGLALQLLLSNQEPVRLYQSYSVKAPALGGEAQIDLYARFIRPISSSANMSAGVANAEVAFVVEYL
ncbi:putative fimbrial protein [Pseudomonas lactis]|uniref:Putative fimbrial protein n=1 Tax=Pseudomonas lactis TaxID=1615674 RepID=I4K7J4_9PSED|nr:putative fimbrial protein [Pseudomonas lactis]